MSGHHDISESTDDIGLLTSLRNDVRHAAAPRAGDDALLAALVAGAVATPRAAVSRRRGPRWVPLPVAAGLVALLSAAAGAALWSGARSWVRGRDTRSAVVSALPSGGVARHARAPLPVGVEAAQIPGAEAPPANPTASAAPSLSPPRRGSVPQDRAPSASSGELFADANRLRHAGDYRGAAARYARLRGRFRGAPEEISSRVIFGQLLLDRLESPRHALALFDSYLADRPSGVLVEEARYGRALALGRAGDHAAERAAWGELLGAHPGSIYAGEARRRLAEHR